MAKAISKTRQLASIGLFLLALPLVFLGVIDPLEGGLALIAALLVYMVAFLLAGHGPSKVLWIPFVCAVAIGVLVLVLAIFGPDRVGAQGPFIPLLIGNWVYRAAVIATLVGAVIPAVNAIRSRTK